MYLIYNSETKQIMVMESHRAGLRHMFHSPDPTYLWLHDVTVGQWVELSDTQSMIDNMCLKYMYKSVKHPPVLDPPL